MVTERTLNLKKYKRNEIRKELVNIFIEEECGSGKGEKCSKYIYYVEILEDGNRVYLKRPANLNKGFDFEIHVENLKFDTRIKTRPKHKNVFDDLQEKKSENPEMFKELLKTIDKIYECKSVTKDEIKKFKFQSGYATEIILMVIKWMFIEQDVTYWNWSGRNMLYSGIKEI